MLSITESFFYEYMPVLSFVYCIISSHFIYSFHIISSLHILHIDGVNHLIRLVFITSEPSSFFLSSFFAIHRYNTSNHEYWPSPPSTRNVCLDADLCASISWQFSALSGHASPSSRTPLIHGRRLLSFLKTNLFIFHEILFLTFSLNKKSMVALIRTLDFQANAHEACTNPQDHGVLAD